MIFKATNFNISSSMFCVILNPDLTLFYTGRSGFEIRERQNGHHSVPSVMYLSFAKFEEHCSNISDILDSVLYCFGETIYDVFTFLICTRQKREYP